MFKNLNRVTYRVPDLEKAKHWYRAILGVEPVFDSSFAAVFLIGSSTLLLTPHAGAASNHDDRVIAYWGVDDVGLAYERLLQAGASPHSEVTTTFGTTRASVRDPFGNLVGVIGTEADKSKGFVEHRPSETAMNVTFSRSLAALDEREEIRGPDYLAEVFLSEDRRRHFKDRAARDRLIKTPPGMYEYVIARTKFFDQIVEQALRADFPQIVLFGAGYDSRAYRFAGLIHETRIFELDALPTQKRKKELLRRANISLPERLAFVPINFKTDDLNDVLFKAGYDKSKKTLFLLEGVTFYLPPQVVDDLLDFIKTGSPNGSTVCFDYRTLLPESSHAYGAEEFMQIMQTRFVAEPLLFGLQEGELGSFLSIRGLAIIDHLTAEDMEKKYLTLRNGTLAGRVTALFGLVHAAVAG